LIFVYNYTGNFLFCQTIGLIIFFNYSMINAAAGGYAGGDSLLWMKKAEHNGGLELWGNLSWRKLEKR
jgi:hypothetical protein